MGVGGTGVGVSIAIGSGVDALASTRAGCGPGPPQAESKTDKASTRLTKRGDLFLLAMLLILDLTLSPTMIIRMIPERRWHQPDVASHMPSCD